MTTDDHQVTRLIWAIVTEEPTLALREIAKRAGLRAFSAVFYHLKKLLSAGYIQRVRGENRAIKVVVPFYVDDVARMSVVIRSTMAKERRAKIAIQKKCDVCGRAKEGHLYCSQCKIAVGEGHIFDNSKEGMCAACYRKQRKAA